MSKLNQVEQENLEKMLDKVRKLLALAGNNPSEEEAKAAALKAHQLIAKYNLNLTDTEKETMEMSQAEYKTGVDKSWKYGLARTVSDNFRVCCFWVDNRKVVFYGYKQDVEVAAQVFGFLFKTRERGARAACRVAYKEKGTETGVYYAYTRGFTSGVKSALDAQSTALMVVTPKEVKESYESYKQEVGLVPLGRCRNGSEKGFNKSAFNDGYKDGKDAISQRSIESRNH